jgi:hypothetical protein
MRIGNARIEDSGETARLIYEIECDRFGKTELWFEIQHSHKSFLTPERYDAALVCMLYPAMYYGEDIQIQGAVSGKLLHAVRWYIQGILHSYNQTVSYISIQVDDVLYETVRGPFVGTGFSGGVDSFNTIYDHFELETVKEYTINALAFLNVGSHGAFADVHTENKSLERYAYLSQYAKDVSLPFVYLNSNVHYFHSDFGHQHTCTLTLAAGILAMQKGFRLYYVSSSIGYYEVDQWYKAANFDITEYADAYLLPLLSTDLLTFLPDGQQKTRSQKTLHILNYKPALQYLNVCVNPTILDSKNCSACHKCCRTLLTVETAGMLEKLNKVFNLEIWKRKRKEYLMNQVLRQEDPFAKDILQFRQKTGADIPGWLSASIYLGLKQLVKRTKRRIKRLARYILSPIIDR